MKRFMYDYFTTSKSLELNNDNLGVKSSQIPDQSVSLPALPASHDKNSGILDITAYIDKHLSNSEKLEALNTIWMPGKKHDFPITQHDSKNFKFQLSWLDKWNWIVYSSLEDGVYCKYY